MFRFHKNALIGLVIFFLLLISSWSAREEPSVLLRKSMAGIGATAEVASVHAWTKLPAGEWTEGALEAAVRLGVASLDEALDAYQLERFSNAEYSTACAHSLANGRELVITARALRPESEAFMTVTIAGSPDQSFGWEEQAKKVLRSTGGLPRISSCLVGWISGKLSNGKRTDLQIQSFAVLAATRISEMGDDTSVWSVTGYSPRLPAGLALGDTEINVNLASRYSSYDDRTYITLGTPIIAREY